MINDSNGHAMVLCAIGRCSSSMNLMIPSVLETGVRRRGLLGEETMRRLVLMLATALIPVTRLIAKQ